MKVIMRMFLAEAVMTRWAVMQQLLYLENIDVGMREVSLLLDHPTVQVMGQDPAANHLLIHVFQPILRFV
jgi:hypothetical protein